MKYILTALLLCGGAQTAWTIGPVVYVAQTENFCADLNGTTYYLYVYSPDDADFSGVSFDLDIGGIVSGPPVVSVDGLAGVVLEAVDTSSLPYHIEITWSPRLLQHEKIAALSFSSEPVWDQGPRTTNVVFSRPGGETVPGWNFTTYPGYPGGCQLCFLCFELDERVQVPAGETTMIPFEWSFFCYTSGGLNIVVTDTKGWVDSWSPTGGTGDGYCHACFAEYSPGAIYVTVPQNAPSGTTSALKIEGNLNGYLCPGYATLEVVDSVPVERTTWSKLKALYR